MTPTLKHWQMLVIRSILFLAFQALIAADWFIRVLERFRGLVEIPACILMAST